MSQNLDHTAESIRLAALRAAELRNMRKELAHLRTVPCTDEVHARMVVLLEQIVARESVDRWSWERGLAAGEAAAAAKEEGANVGPKGERNSDLVSGLGQTTAQARGRFQVCPVCLCESGVYAHHSFRNRPPTRPTTYRPGRPGRPGPISRPPTSLYLPHPSRTTNLTPTTTIKMSNNPDHNAAALRIAAARAKELRDMRAELAHLRTLPCTDEVHARMVVLLEEIVERESAEWWSWERGLAAGEAAARESAGGEAKK
ncbi:hypothetical protein EDC01DRAFT_781572 [Geopyxis carbonaria]|nr:hypothetical protein EDC01DRAFT_781572 [Geopyxis carbonaria]